MITAMGDVMRRAYERIEHICEIVLRSGVKP